MADVKISALTAATTPLAGTEVLPIVQSGVTTKVAVSDLTAGRAVALGATTITGALSVSGITTVAAGTAALPAIVSTTGTADTGLWFPAADTVAASTAGAERLRIDSAGLVGIGTSSPSSKLHVVSSSGENKIISEATAASQQASMSLIVQAATPGQTVIYMGKTGASTNGQLGYDPNTNAMTLFTNNAERMRINSSGNVGIGTSSPSYQLQVNTDSAGKPGVGGLWTVVSDERIKSNIVPANLDRCYEIVKSVPLKHFGFAPGVYTDDQIQDKHNLGWIAQDVQKVFKNAVSVKPFTLKTDIPYGVEEYEEQDFTLESVEKTETSIQVINGKPVQVSKVVKTENKVLTFDTVDVVDEAGNVVMDGDKPLTYQMPRMITKTRPKVRHDVIEDCLDLNNGQMIAALYGCVQALMAKVEALEAKA
tara:strand:- start:116 stop:1384 length:1269 start_codon:yes stop_codon:yes gene_type:complete